MLEDTLLLSKDFVYKSLDRLGINKGRTLKNLSILEKKGTI